MEIVGKFAATYEMSWNPNPRNLAGQVLSNGVEVHRRQTCCACSS